MYGTTLPQSFCRSDHCLWLHAPFIQRSQIAKYLNYRRIRHEAIWLGKIRPWGVQIAEIAHKDTESHCEEDSWNHEEAEDGKEKLKCGEVECDATDKGTDDV